VRAEYPTLRKERQGWGTRRPVAGIESEGRSRGLVIALNYRDREAILSQRSFMISHRHWRIWTAIAALALILSLVMLSPVGLACFVLLPFSFIGLIPIPVLLLRRELLHADHIPDAPCLPASFQRPPPFQLA
jgi:hypothetical protein